MNEKIIKKTYKELLAPHRPLPRPSLVDSLVDIDPTRKLITLNISLQFDN